MYDLRLFVEYKKQAKKKANLKLLFPVDIRCKEFLALYKDAVYKVIVENVGNPWNSYNKMTVYLWALTLNKLGSFREDNTVSTMNIDNLTYFIDRIEKPKLTEEQKTRMKFDYNEWMKKANDAR